MLPESPRSALAPQPPAWEPCAPQPPPPPPLPEPLPPCPQRQQQQQGQQHRRQARVFASKHDSTAHVKQLQRPLYAQGLVTRDQFREAARAATHALYRRCGGPDAMRTASKVAQALAEALAELDLRRAAVAVLHAS